GGWMVCGEGSAPGDVRDSCRRSRAGHCWGSGAVPDAERSVVRCTAARFDHGPCRPCACEGLTMDATPTFDWAIRATLLLAIAVLLARLLERRSASAAHQLLATGLGCILLVLPPGMSFLPGWEWTVPAWEGAAPFELCSDSNEHVHSPAPPAGLGGIEGDSEKPVLTAVDVASMFHAT